MQINTTAIITAIVIAFLGSSGLMGLFFWSYRRNVAKADQALADVLQKIHSRQEEHGNRLHDIETTHYVTTEAMEARMGPLDTQIREMATSVATMKGNMEGMNRMAQGMINSSQHRG